ncbi:MAG: hypothetical protein CVV23_03035 [Ignavibacteriae bacterium HGW-Ignavibacteriae-2]|jgi:hypothetical protein|nr:MAG: hypothetical protein CVV23_03035 [Ignavibacteriae bacterium HGW-Ignavibacteriae-2]
MKKAFVVILLFISFSSMLAQKQKKIYELTNKQIDSVLNEVSKKNMTITERMKYYSSMFLGMPYNLTCSGDGPYALYETEPLVNFKQTNCMVYCEHVLALSISDSWDNFFNNLQKIRYADGIIGMRTRNHYTMADWLPENSWLLHDASRKVGEAKTKQVTRTISHKDFFTNKGITDLRYVKPDRTITIDYLPFEVFKENQNHLQSGDIIALLFAKLNNIFSAHMLMVFDSDNGLIIRESALSSKTTFDTPLNKWVDKYLNSEKYLGIAVMRVNENINTPGNIILPWEIKKSNK